MSSYLPPTEDLPVFNPSVFQNGSTEGITLSDADTRYVKKSGSIMSGALSTPSLLVNSIDVETEIDKISPLQTKTTDITYTGSTTTIANNLDIDGVLSTPSIANLQTAINLNTAKTGVSSEQETNIDKIPTLETKTTDITFAGTTTSIANDLVIGVGGVLSTPSIANLEAAINLNTAKTGVSSEQELEIDKIPTLDSKTTDITFSSSTTTIANNLDIDGVLSTPSIANLQTAINLNTAKTGVSSQQETNIDKIPDLETKTTDITYTASSGGDPSKTTIAYNLDIDGTLSTPSIANLQVDILANTSKIATLGSAYVYWQSSTTSNLWGNNNRLDTLTSSYLKIGNLNIEANSSRNGAVDVGVGTYRIKVVGDIKPRQSGSVTITSDRIEFLMYLSVNNSETTTPTISTPSASGYMRQLNNGPQGYGNNLSFETVMYFSDTTELSIKTQLYASANRTYTGTLSEDSLVMGCLMIVEKISGSDIEVTETWD